jgi:hypothetical protein
MKNILLCLLVLPLAGCLATSAELRSIADHVAIVEEKVEDETASPEEVADALDALQAELLEVADRVDERASETLLTLEDGLKGGGAVGLLTALGLNLYRNGQRRRRGEVVTQSEAEARRGSS